MTNIPHPINHTNLLYNYNKEEVIKFLTKSGFRFCAQVTPLPDMPDQYEVTTHPLCVDWMRSISNEEEHDVSIFPPNFEPFEYQLLKKEIEEYKVILDNIKDALGCNYIQLTRPALLSNFLTNRGFTPDA